MSQDIKLTTAARARNLIRAKQSSRGLAATTSVPKVITKVQPTTNVVAQARTEAI